MIQIGDNVRILIDFIMSEDIKDTNQLIANHPVETAMNQTTINQEETQQVQNLDPIQVENIQPDKVDNIVSLHNSQQELNELTHIQQETQHLQQPQSLNSHSETTQQLVSANQEILSIQNQHIQETNLNKQGEVGTDEITQINLNQRYYSQQDVIALMNEDTNQQNNEIIDTNSNYQEIVDGNGEEDQQTQNVVQITQTSKIEHQYEQIPLQEYREEDLVISNQQIAQKECSQFKFIGMEESTIKQNKDLLKPTDQIEQSIKLNNQQSQIAQVQARVEFLQPILQMGQLVQNKGSQQPHQQTAALKISQTIKINIPQSLVQKQITDLEVRKNKIQLNQQQPRRIEPQVQIQKPNILIKQEIKHKKQQQSVTTKQIQQPKQVKQQNILINNTQPIKIIQKQKIQVIKSPPQNILKSQAVIQSAQINKQTKSIQVLKKEDVNKIKKIQEQKKQQVQQNYFKKLPKKAVIATSSQPKNEQISNKNQSYIRSLSPPQIVYQQKQEIQQKIIKKSENRPYSQSLHIDRQSTQPQQSLIKQTEQTQPKKVKKAHKKKKKNNKHKNSQQIPKNEQILPSKPIYHQNTIPSNQNNNRITSQNEEGKQPQKLLIVSTANSLQHPIVSSLEHTNVQNMARESDPDAPVLTNQFIIHQAERERMNSTYNIFLKYMMNYSKALIFYKNVVENVYQQIFRRKNQKRVLQNILRNYFEGYAKLNRQFSQDNTKLLPFQLPGSKNPFGNIGLELRRGFDQLIYLRRTVAGENLKINNFCITTIVQSISKAFTKYYDRVSFEQSKFFDKRQQHQARQKLFFKVVSQVDKVFRQGINGKFKKDILSQVARLINEEQGHRQILKNYGKSIVPVRLTYISAQKQLFETLQNILNQFKNQSKIIYSVGRKEFHHIQDITHIIKEKNDFQQLSPLTDTDYIKYVLQIEVKKETNNFNNMDFEHFLELAYFDKIVGNIRDIYKGTINKSFPLSAPNEQLLHTISGNLVQFNREMDHVLNTFVVDNINAKIINQGIVQFDQVLKGIIFNDYRTIRVKLLDSDRAEELICFLDQKTETIVIQ